MTFRAVTMASIRDLVLELFSGRGTEMGGVKKLQIQKNQLGLIKIPRRNITQ